MKDRWCMQCALLTPPDHREAAGKDEEGEPACRKHAVDLPVVVIHPAAAATKPSLVADVAKLARHVLKRVAVATPPAPTAVVAEAEEENGMKEGRQEKIVALAKEGKSYAEIGKIVGVTGGTIGYYLKKAGISTLGIRKGSGKTRRVMIAKPAPEPDLDNMSDAELSRSLHSAPMPPAASPAVVPDLVNEIWNALPHELKRQVLRNAL